MEIALEVATRGETKKIRGLIDNVDLAVPKKAADAIAIITVKKLN